MYFSHSKFPLLGCSFLLPMLVPWVRRKTEDYRQNLCVRIGKSKNYVAFKTYFKLSNQYFGKKYIFFFFLRNIVHQATQHSATLRQWTKCQTDAVHPFFCSTGSLTPPSQKQESFSSAPQWWCGLFRVTS